MSAPRPTHLRDARLHHALAHAPDAQAAPAEATRAAILRHAHAAVATPAAVAPLPWWTRLAQALDGPRRPWNAGFATVLLACVAAGLWWERDVPGPTPDAPRPLPAPVTQQAPAQQEATAPTDKPGADAAPQAHEKKVLSPPRPQPAPATPRPEPAVPPAPAAAKPSAEVQLRARAPSPRAAAEGTPAAQDTEDMTAARASRASAGSPSRPSATPELAEPAPAAAPDAFAWTALRRQPAAARARASLPADLAQAIDGLLRTGATAVPADDPVLARIALLHEGGAVLGVLELGAYSLRWTPAGDRLPRGFAARVEPATSQRIRETLAP